MIIGSRQRLKTLPHSPSLKIDGVPISQVPSTKSLGVYIDQNLTWNVHIENLSKKIASGIGALKRIRPFVPHKTLLFIYNSLVKPHFDYCNVIWGSCNKTLVNKLQKLQNHAARVLACRTWVGRLFHNSAPLYLKLFLRKLVRGRGTASLSLVLRRE